MNSIAQGEHYDGLLAYARRPDEALTRVFAGVLQTAGRGQIRPFKPGLGLAPEQYAALLDTYFPGVRPEFCAEATTIRLDAGRAAPSDEFDDLLALLLEHRSDNSELAVWLAHAIASACLGSEHLYRDMGLPDRQMLSALMQTYFNALYLKNAGKMKWKKFLYKQLCERAEIKACPAPSCGVCAEYRHCFVTE
ncbi:MAG: nitrogen fixation protein NifQ [Burkholderiales bacterium]